MALTRSVTEAIARHVAERATARGLDGAAALAAAGVDAHARPDATRHVSAAAYLALWERLLSASAEPALGLAIGREYRVERIEALGFLALASADLGDAFARFARLRALYNRGARWAMDPDGDDRLRLTWHPWAEPRASGRAREAADQHALMEMVVAAEQLAGHPVAPLAVSFAHPRPRDDAPHRRILGVRPRFAAPETALWFPASTLALPCRLSNAALREWLEQSCRAALAAAADTLEAQIEAWILRDLGQGEPSMARLARALATTPRTVHRRLAKEGTSFTAILDRVRREVAAAYLGRPGLSVGEVSALLGFADAGAFVRAFRRWYGTTPGRWRARGGAAPTPTTS